MKRSEIRKKDKEWSLAVRTRDGFKCFLCGKINKHNNAHHILPRTIRQTRWDLMNGKTLCAYDHRWNKFLSPHQNAIGFAIQLKYYDLKAYKYVLDKFNEINYGRNKQ